MSWQRPRRGFRLGQMRHRITIRYALVVTTAGEPVTTWLVRYQDEPASFEPSVGTETIRGRQVEANTKAVFVIHNRGGVSIDDRVEFDSDTYGIVAIVPSGGGDRYLELHCRGLAE